MQYKTPFGQVAGRRVTEPLDRGDVLDLVSKAGWRAADIDVPILTPADTSFIGRVSDALIDLAPEPGCRFTVEYFDSNGDGEGDVWMVGFRCSI